MRLVAKTFTLGATESSWLTTGAASETCSKLSIDP
jgi:hypothetical protein